MVRMAAVRATKVAAPKRTMKGSSSGWQPSHARMHTSARAEPAQEAASTSQGMGVGGMKRHQGRRARYWRRFTDITACCTSTFDCDKGLVSHVPTARHVSILPAIRSCVYSVAACILLL